MAAISEERQPSKDEFHEMSDDEEIVKAPPSKAKLAVRVAVGILFLTLVVLAIVFNRQAGEALQNFLTWIGSIGVWGAFVFILAYILATVFALPGLILTLGAGFVFTRSTNSTGLGVLIGSASVFVGATLGACAAFLVGRYLLRDTVEQWAKKYKVMQAIERALEKQGLRTVLLLRLSPAIPFNAFNYLMGLTSVKFRDYLFGSVGMLPGTITFVFFGSALGGLSDTTGDRTPEQQQIQLIILIVGSILAIVGIILVSRTAKKELNKALAEDEEGSDIEEGAGGSDAKEGDKSEGKEAEEGEKEDDEEEDKA
eukprot:PLAT6834.1.p1 GENE.PLAT6834.1~~PLAT6834.1.p1  ORF type:complete len:312 (+),score=139.44 PLAT6834.1:37-972(+)